MSPSNYFYQLETSRAIICPIYLERFKSPIILCIFYSVSICCLALDFLPADNKRPQPKRISSNIRSYLFLTWSVKLMKTHIKLNLYSSICRAIGLNLVIL